MIKRLKEIGRYLLELALATGANFLIMPPTVALTQYVLTKYFDVLFLPMFFGGGGRLPSMGYVLFYFLLVGIKEEAIFRYCIQDCLFEKLLKFPQWLSLTLASVVFGAAHLFNPAGMPYTIPQAVGAMMAGFLFGYVYRKRGLHFAMLTHGLYDFFVIFLATR